MLTSTTGLASTAAATLTAGAAPRSTSGCIFAGERFQTVTPCPPLTSDRASADPIRPSPKAEMSLINNSFVRCSRKRETPSIPEGRERIDHEFLPERKMHDPRPD